MTFANEMKIFATIVFSAAINTAFCQSNLETVRDAGSSISVIICGVADSPKEVTLSAGAGVRGALFFSNNGRSHYGSVPRTRIQRGEFLYQTPRANLPDVRLKEGDFLEIPLRAPYEGMAEPRRILVAVDLMRKFDDSVYIQSNFSFSGVWRTNWWDGIRGRENLLTDNNSYHSMFICPVPVSFKVAKSQEEPHEAIALDDKKNYFLITFREIRALDMEPQFTDREHEIVTAICRKLNGNPYLLRRDLPNHPWRMTAFEEKEKANRVPGSS